MFKGTYKEPVYKSSLDDEGITRKTRGVADGSPNGGSYLN